MTKKKSKTEDVAEEATEPAVEQAEPPAATVEPVAAKPKKRAKGKTPKSKAETAEVAAHPEEKTDPKKKMGVRAYEKALSRLQIELVKLQEWIKAKGLKVVVIFEGRDAAGKGGAIKTHHAGPESAYLPRGGAGHARPSVRKPSGTSSATCPICPRPARWCCLTAAGTTGPASNG